jgi:anaerobic magnesium-protoporphyrin IX monomethyl ester cyclase
MAKFKITLINPPVDIKEIYGKYSDLAAFQPPIGLCSLAAYLKKFNYESNIIDAAILGLGVSSTADLVDKSAPDLVGIYSTTANFNIACRLAEEIKSRKKDRKIVIGGPHPSFMPEETLGQGYFDFSVIGEGEETLLELVRCLEDSRTGFKVIDGLAFKDSYGRIVVNPRRRQIEPLDSLPFPAVELLPNLSKYKLYLLHYKKMPYMTVVTTRGCPFSCVFCNTPFGRQVRYHSASYIVDYIAYLNKEFGVKEVHFSDDTFTMNEERVMEICDLLRARKLKVNWYANIRADLKNKSILKEMKKAGCWIAALGAESGDEGILKLIKKNISLKQVSLTAEAVTRAGIKLKVFFIIGNPGETPETIDATIRFARGLNAHFPVFSLMTPYPGTELWDTAERYGSFDKSNFGRLTVSTSDPAFIPFGVTREILLAKQKEAFRKAYFNIPMIIRQVASIDSPEDLIRKMRAGLVFAKNFMLRR